VSQVVVRMFHIWEIVRLGFFCFIRAMAPATWGEAQEVPLIVAYP
jgi:hypothetical protein